nr:unnamed protein product [uncultured bacterium]
MSIIGLGNINTGCIMAVSVITAFFLERIFSMWSITPLVLLEICLSGVLGEFLHFVSILAML